MPIYTLGELGAVGNLGVLPRTGRKYRQSVQTKTIEIPYGNKGIMVSAGHLANMIRTWRKNQDPIRFLAEDIIKKARCKPKDYRCEAESIFYWVTENIKFLRDTHGVERLESPIVALDTGFGDCDCLTILLSSLLQSIGHPTRIVLIATRSTRPKAFNHVFTEVRVPQNGKKDGIPIPGTREKWIALDPTPLNKEGRFFRPGNRPPGYTYKAIEVN
jgi:hypothetical protein